MNVMLEPRCAAIPVIVISADATERQIEAGARDYLTKPLTLRNSWRFSTAFRAPANCAALIP